MAANETRSPTGLTYQSVLDADRTETIEVLRRHGEDGFDAGLDVARPIDLARYHTVEFAELEHRLLWSNVWQMACRVENLPEVGDHLLYEVGDLSLIVVRSAPDTISAFHNSCLHRGTALVERSGNTAVFRCPFHGFAWGIDGEFRGMPAAWDFPHVDVTQMCLPQARVAIWQGFVFVHPGPDPEPFETFSTPLEEHFAQHPLTERYVSAHAAQVVAANWKTTLEAFLEGYHVSTTHPHTVRFANDFEMQYDAFGPNVSRLLQAIAVPASALIGKVPAAEMAAMVQRLLPPADRVEVPADLDEAGLRAWLGQQFRSSFSRRWRTDLSAASEAELLDSIQYFLFPNFSPWMGYSVPIVYRFRPHGSDPNQCLMEIMLLHPIPEDGDYQVATVHQLEPSQSWTVAPGFERMGMVIDQDMDNLPRVQRGLRAARHSSLTLADYQELRIRHFHARLDRQLDLA